MQIILWSFTSGCGARNCNKSMSESDSDESMNINIKNTKIENGLRISRHCLSAALGNRGLEPKWLRIHRLGNRFARTAYYIIEGCPTTSLAFNHLPTPLPGMQPCTRRMLLRNQHTYIHITCLNHSHKHNTYVLPITHVHLFCRATRVSCGPTQSLLIKRNQSRSG